MRDAELRVHNLPQGIAAEDLAGSTVVVIDVLRATSTICQALASGAREIVPFLEIEQTIAAAEKAGRASVILGGERGGKRIDGFDLGNSPREYTRAAVGGRRVFITTTNGTRAMHHARQAARVILGSFLNLSAVTAAVKNEPCIDILCAGTNGCETKEDILMAGAMVGHLEQFPDAEWYTNEAAKSAFRVWGAQLGKSVVTSRPIKERLPIDLRVTPGGRNLIEIGLDQDIVDCAQIDQLDVVPELDVRAWRITAN